MARSTTYAPIPARPLSAPGPLSSHSALGSFSPADAGSSHASAGSAGLAAHAGLCWAGGRLPALPVVPVRSRSRVLASRSSRGPPAPRASPGPELPVHCVAPSQQSGLGWEFRHNALLRRYEGKGRTRLAASGGQAKLAKPHLCQCRPDRVGRFGDQKTAPAARIILAQLRLG